jgi:plastocyanin
MKTRFALRSITYIACIVLAAASCGEYSNSKTPAERPAQPNVVWMQNDMFIPANLTVPAGTTVTWLNRDSRAHTVTSGTRSNQTGMFDSGEIGQDRTFTFTFNDPGIYQYYCQFHRDMTGTVRVTGTGQGTAAAIDRSAAGH